ncbi:MAG: membrane protein insertion efficiency factor YidD [Bacteroidia bacterium]
MRLLLSNFFILLIKLYRALISPLLPNACRFTPTCSDYGIQAFKKYGPFKGLIKTADRISRCHPWGGHGHDPLD